MKWGITIQMNPLLAQAANTGLGILSGAIENEMQFGLQKRLNQNQVKWSKELMNFQQMKQMEMWEKTGYGAQVKQMNEAGINPGLLYGMSGGGAQTTGNVSATAQGGQAGKGTSIQGMMGMGIQQALAQAQIKNLESQANLNQVEANKKQGVDTENVAADTQNKILQAIITKYTGKEAKDTYERVVSPSRGVQAKTYQDELEARQGIAGTIYEMWQQGKLAEKSITEIEQLLLQNEKLKGETRNIIKTMDLLEENIKGAKLDNIIKDLEARLQTQTGIDRNSPAWLKVLGRLFVELIMK